MIAILFFLFSMCPVMDTGKFYFKELISTSGSVDTFFGRIYVSPYKTIRVDVVYPDTALWLFSNDSIYMIMEADTQIFYKQGLFNLIFDSEKSDTLFLVKRNKHGCLVFSKDTTIYDTLFIFGGKYIDSLYFKSRETKVRFYLRKEK